MIDTLDVIEKVNALYSSAFNQMLTYTIGLMAFVGILLPIFISFLQNRQFRKEHEATTATVLKEIKEAQEKLEKLISDEIESKYDIFKLELMSLVENKTAGVSGRVNHNQALTSLKDEDFVGAINTCVWAANDYLTAQDEGNLVRILNILSGTMKRISKADFEENDNLEKTLLNFIESICNLNSTGRYTDEITNFRRDLKAAQKRVTVTE